MKLLEPKLDAGRFFGTYALGESQAQALRFAAQGRSSRWGEFISSARRKWALAGRTGQPVDIKSPWGDEVRLYAHDNTTDKNLMYGITPAHDQELRAMQAVAKNSENGIFFCDVGANSGLYSLQVANHLDLQGSEQPHQMLCVEPNPPMQIRLQENLALNGLDQARIATSALSDAEGEIELDISFSKNLGKVRIPQKGARSELTVKVPMTTFAKMLEQIGWGVPDIVKIDIEGHEQTMLDHFWQEAPDMRPALIVIEMWPKEKTNLIECMARGGYRFAGQPSENAVFLHNTFSGTETYGEI
jgi:FkbM family methyltransferase